jgi:hypothetical protein
MFISIAFRKSSTGYITTRRVCLSIRTASASRVIAAAGTQMRGTPAFVVMSA